jgi:DNA ligase 1
MDRRKLFALPALVSISAVPLQADAAAPRLLEAQNWKDGTDPAGYLVSEKLDGVRAVWDGSVLRFRSGQTIAAPAWFTQALPREALDGELWLARGKFDALSGAVRREQPLDAQWRALSFHVFELPNGTGSFADRAQRIAQLVKSQAFAQLRAAEQFKVANAAALAARLKAVVAAGGEGLMLHRADAPYETGRSGALFKLKPLSDAEAQVIGHIPGKGKHAGKMGALEVQTADGTRFKLGTGFTDAQRNSPPPVGTWVTYTYRDTTPSGKPRFAAFLRVREVP